MFVHENWWKANHFCCKENLFILAFLKERKELYSEQYNLLLTKNHNGCPCNLFYSKTICVCVCVLVCVCVCAFLKNATIGYSLESVCVCVCVFLHDNSKRKRSRNTKLEYIVVYENTLDEFDIELRRIKVRVTVGVQKFSPFTTIQTVRTYSSTLVQARNLILSIYLHLILIYKIYECRYA